MRTPISTRPKVRIGLVGYGSWAERVHIPSIALADSAQLVAVCGPDAGKAEAMARQYGAAWSTNDPLHIATADDIDAVLICSPNNAHAPVAIAAAQAGKHVLCEKPLARTLAEAREMARAAQHAGIRHMTAFTWRNVPAARHTQHLVAAGEIGHVLHASAHFLHGGWLKLDNKRPWRFDRARMGSGILGDLGVHVFDLLAWMIGSPITRVCAQLSTFGPKPAVAGQEPVFDDGHLLLEFGNGAHGSVRISRIATSASRPPFPDMHQGIELYGDAGALVYDLHRHSQVELRRPKTPTRLLDAPDPLPASADEWIVTHEMGRRQIERFARAVLDGHPASPDFADGLRAQAVMDAAERSQAASGWVNVDNVDREQS